jgi:hypothetical protein
MTTEVICWLNPDQILRMKNEKPNRNISRVGSETVCKERLISRNLTRITGIRINTSGRVNRIIIREKLLIPNR